MPDKWGRMYGNDRRSAALLRLTYWAFEDFEAVKDDTGFRQGVRLARIAGCDDEEIAAHTGFNQEQLSELGQET